MVGLTLIPESVPVVADVVVSVAVIDWLPAVLSVTLKVAVPSSPAGNLKFDGRPAWESLLVNAIVPV